MIAGAVFLTGSLHVATNCDEKEVYNRSKRLRARGYDMVVYGDILFVENFITGAALIYISSAAAGKEFRGRRDIMRLAAGGAMCGLFSFVIFLPVRGAALMVMEAAFAVLVCFEAAGRKRILARTVSFVLTTYFAGGMIMALLVIWEQEGIYTAAGIYTGDMKAPMAAVFFCAVVITTRQIIKTVSKIKFRHEHILDAEIYRQGRTIKVKALLDTGNDLREPISGRPVAVAGEELWKEIRRMGFVTEERTAVIPYESIGKRGVLEAVRVDGVKAGEKRMGACFIARGERDTAFGSEKGEEFGLILPGCMADIKIGREK